MKEKPLKNGQAVSRVMSWNIGRGLLKKLPEIESVLKSLCINICFIIECDDSQENIETIAIPGFNTIVCSTQHRGDKIRIFALIDNTLPHKVRLDLMNNNVPTIWIELISETKKNILIGGIYREWNDKQPEDMSLICNQISSASEEGLPLLCIGDINLDMLLWDKSSFRLKSLADQWKAKISTAGLKWENLGETFESYYTTTSGHKVKSGLDHIYHNGTGIFNNFKKSPNSLSDHRPIYCDINIAPKKVEKEEQFILRRSWTNFDMNKFQADLTNQPWELVIDPSKSVDQQAEIFDDIYTQTINKHAPIRKTKIRPNFKKGLSKKTLQLIKERDSARLESSRCQDTSKQQFLSAEYKKKRNAVTSRIRKEAKSATLTSFKESGGPSEIWKTANKHVGTATSSKLKLKEKVKIFGPEKTEKSPPVAQYDMTIDKEEDLAKVFNCFFKSKVEKIEKEIPKKDIDSTHKLREKMNGRNLEFSIKPVTIKQVLKAIKCLKNKTSSGIDFISPKLLKQTADIIAAPLTFIINNSIEEGVFPQSWKTAKVIPIFKKKGSKAEKENYRPVSNLKSASKVIELIVNKQVLNFFETNGLFPGSQHGFRGKRSTFSAVATMHEIWLKNHEKKEHQAISFLDLSAAFDTLSKDIFCQKLEVYGFNETSVNWFRSYLSNRFQCVIIGSHISDPVLLSVGSPQGAILSPTVFIILISDIDLWTNAQLCGYADDTSCTVSVKSMQTLQEKCEESVHDLLTYMAVNRLAANDSKTHIIVVKSGQKTHAPMKFNIGNAKVDETETEKLLGIHVSNDLKWSDHLSKLQSKLMTRLYTLRKLEQVIPKSLLKTVADGIFMSVLRYGLGIFCPIRVTQSDPHPSSISGIKVAFNDMLRLLCSAKREDHMSVEEMLKKLNWLSVNQIAAEVRLIETWKSIHTNYCLSNVFEKRVSSYETRAAGKNALEVEEKSRLRENSFQFPCTKLWNIAPQSITNAQTESFARKAIRDYVKTLPL